MKEELAKELVSKGFVEQDFSSIELPLNMKVRQFVKEIDASRTLYFTSSLSDVCEEIQEFHFYNFDTNTKLYLMTKDVDLAIKCAEIIDIDPEDVEGIPLDLKSFSEN